MSVEKIPYKDFKKSITSFFVDEELEEKMSKKQDEIVKNTRKRMKDIDTKEGLEQFIRSDKESLQQLTNILGISQERLKRTVSMIRRGNGEDFNSEWNIQTIRNQMVHNNYYMERICDLLINGSNDPEYKETIPRFILEQMVIDQRRLKLLTSKYALQQYIKPSFEGIYSNAVGDKIEEIISIKLTEWCQKYGTTFVHEKNIPWIARNIDFVIPDVDNPKILIEVSYMVTTGSGQTTKQRDEHQTRLRIDDYNRNNRENVIFVNFIDGAGWLGRQNDLRLLYEDSDYVVNLKYLDSLEEVIKSYS